MSAVQRLTSSDLMNKKKQKSVAKISRPYVGDIVLRKRLFKLLDDGRPFPVIWISGPPGSGKTTLAASYLDSRKLPCLWYRLDEGDADISTFFYYLGEAAKSAAPRKRKSLPLLTPDYLAGLPAFSRRYFEELFNRFKHVNFSPGKNGTKGFALVLDNYQDVPVNSGFHDMIIHCLDSIPEGANIIVLSRSEPPAQLVRIRANNRIHFIRWNDIRFIPEESREIGRMRGNGTLSENVLARLHDKTDGWVAGLTLMIEALKKENIVPELEGRHTPQEVFDYFAGEVFHKTDGELRAFLLKTAFLPDIDPRLAGELSGITGSEQILSRLNRDQYFTEKHFRSSPVYRYHPLFREFLLTKAKSEFDEGELRSIRRKAAALLESSGKPEDAALLLRDAGDTDGFIRLVLGNAPALAAQGRIKTLEEWINSVPKKIGGKNPHILYWLGICRLPFSPPESRDLLERALHIFEEQGDDAGAFIAWSSIIESILYEWDNFSLLGHWIDWLEARMQQGGTFPAPEIEARVSCSMVVSLMSHRPNSSDIAQWMEKAQSIFLTISDDNLRLNFSMYAALYHGWNGDFNQCTAHLDDADKTARSLGVSPLRMMLLKWVEAEMYIFQGAFDRSFQSVQEGLEIGHKNEVHLWDNMLLGMGAFNLLCRGDKKGAAAFLKKMEMTLDPNRRQGASMFHYLTAWHHLLLGNLSHALLNAEESRRMGRDQEMYPPIIFIHIVQAHIFHAMGERQKALSEVAVVRELCLTMASPLIKYILFMTEAQFALDAGDRTRGIEALKEAMFLGRRHGYINMALWWYSPAVTRLCTKALEEGIEVDYVQHLIRVRNLYPDNPSLDLDNWPWPLKVYTFGKFRIVREDVPITFSRKTQQKPLSLLKALIVRGGLEVPEDDLTDMLWPDADGDLAHLSLKAALHRLRRLLGKPEAIQYKEGVLTLDPQCFWVDAWAFQRTLEKIEDLGKTGGNTHKTEIIKLVKKAVELYQGAFLKNDQSEPWLIEMRKKLRDKFIVVIGRLGDHFEKTGEWEMAVEAYQRALKADNTREEFNSRLIRCRQCLETK